MSSRLGLLKTLEESIPMTSILTIFYVLVEFQTA